MKKKIFLYFAFCLSLMCVFILSVGWNSHENFNIVSETVTNLRNQTKNLCLLSENQQLFCQGVRATNQEERMIYAFQDESSLRAAVTKDIKLKVNGVSISDRDKKILFRIVEAEAGDQDVKGRMLVANVILNRVRSKEFADNIRGVVFAPRQFSPIANGSYYRVKVSKLTKKAVNRVLAGEDFSEGALYFMDRAIAASSNVSWFDRDLTRLFRHGCHEFFR